jgi:hypothetical protein
MTVYALGLWRFARDVLPWRWSRARTAAFLALGALVALRGFWNAQSNALAVGLLLLGASALVRQRWWRSAFLLAGSVCVKLTPLAPALLLCALWPRRLTPRLAVALVLGGVLPFLTRAPDAVVEQYREWVGHLLGSGGARWPGFRDGWTLWVVARHVLGGGEGPVPFLRPIDAGWYHLLQAGSALAALAWCRWQQARGACPRWQVRVTLAVGCGWLMLFGPAVEHATYAFLGAPLAWAFLERQGGRTTRGLAAVAFVLVGCLGWGALSRPLMDRVPLLLAALPLGSALFLAWLLAYAQASAARVRRSLPEPYSVVATRVAVPSAEPAGGRLEELTEAPAATS